jgi:hypothetical protein
MPILLLDDSLQVEIFFDNSDRDYEDDICIQLYEDCPDDERLFMYDETNIYITPDQASLLILALQRAMESYRKSNQDQ